MANIGSAEPLAGPEQNPLDDNTLTQNEKSSGYLTQPYLRIVHNTDRVTDPPADIRLSDRDSQISDRPPAMLDRSIQAQIGRLLRDVFADVAGEPVPDRFIDLLAKLETREKPR
jgi:hypothetical protein